MTLNYSEKMTLTTLMFDKDREALETLTEKNEENPSKRDVITNQRSVRTRTVKTSDLPRETSRGTSRDDT